MLFNSPQFLIFFPIVTALFFSLPHRFRWALLLAASCYFYMAFRPVYIFILIFTILIDYFAGIAIESAQGDRRRRYLLLSIFANVGVLAAFKYFNFVNGNLMGLSHVLGIGYPIPNLNIVLPIGLSFHTFQSLSYTVEVFRGRQKAERHPGIFALYVMFYPQLVAGPIERPQNLLHQFHEEHNFDYRNVTDGLKLMCFGFFKKVVIADRLAPFVNQVYSDPRHYPGISLVLGTVLFAFQIYCDFSGYSDIAIGAARVMGFRLMNNFNRPYFSSSIGNFWKHWHISLSTWFRDYLYIPMGGNRVSTSRKYWNLMVTFVVSGLWHGANWTYILWGAINGFYLIVEQLAGSFERRTGVDTMIAHWPKALVRCFRVALTFSLTCFAWIFFRARTTGDAFYIASHLTAGWRSLPSDLQNLVFVKLNLLMRLDKTEMVIGLVAVTLLIIIELMQHFVNLRDWMAQQPIWLRWAVYYGALSSILFFGAFNTSQEFIYFQF